MGKCGCAECCGCLCIIFCLYLVYMLFGYILLFFGLAFSPFYYVFSMVWWVIWNVGFYVMKFLLFYIFPYGFVGFICAKFQENHLKEVKKVSQLKKELVQYQKTPLLQYYVERMKIMKKTIYLGFLFLIALRVICFYVFNDDIIMEIISYINAAIFLSILMTRRSYDPDARSDYKYNELIIFNFVLLFINLIILDDFFHLYSGNSILFG